MATFNVHDHAVNLEKMYNDTSLNGEQFAEAVNKYVSEQVGQEVKVNNVDRASIFNALNLPLKKRPRGRKVNFVFEQPSGKDYSTNPTPNSLTTDSIDDDPNFSGANEVVNEDTGEVSTPIKQW